MDTPVARQNRAHNLEVRRSDFAMPISERPKCCFGRGHDRRLHESDPQGGNLSDKRQSIRRVVRRPSGQNQNPSVCDAPMMAHPSCRSYQLLHKGQGSASSPIFGVLRETLSPSTHHDMNVGRGSSQLRASRNAGSLGDKTPELKAAAGCAGSCRERNSCT